MTGCLDIRRAHRPKQKIPRSLLPRPRCPLAGDRCAPRARGASASPSLPMNSATHVSRQLRRTRQRRAGVGGATVPSPFGEETEHFHGKPDRPRGVVTAASQRGCRLVTKRGRRGRSRPIWRPEPRFLVPRDPHAARPWARGHRTTLSRPSSSPPGGSHFWLVDGFAPPLEACFVVASRRESFVVHVR